ncbi:MAG: hypothetical protein Q8L49_11200 [Burkholderiaceae bacterium]|nr:hypothetical protein [Burkholderiaceae bacterium]
MDPKPEAHETPHWLDEPRNVKRLWRGFLVVLVLTVLAEMIVQLHPTFEIESVFGFSAWFGFMACAAMIVVAKALAGVLKRPDTYYGKRDD